MNEVELTGGFHNAVLVDGEPDRVYKAEDINEHLKGLVSDSGVYANVSTACQVQNGTGMQVIVRTGRGKIDNHWFKIETDTTLNISAADVILNRIDSIVVRYNSTDRNISLVVKEGTLATTPVAPTLTRTEEIYEICLANISVNKNITAITTSMITDTRPNTSVCGWIACLVNHIDTTTLFEQYEAAQNDFINNQTTEFDEWFEGIKDDVKATSLYREYQATYGAYVGENIITIPTSINYVHNGLDVLNIYINGLKLIEDSEYSISSDGTTITLNTPIDTSVTNIQFVNKKSIDGTVAESVVVQVETLQEEVEALQNISYVATGENDNIKLSNIVKNFLDGAGEYGGISNNASMNINVIGTLIPGDLFDNQILFDFHRTTSSYRKITLDFGNATIQMPTPSTQLDVFAVFGADTPYFGLYNVTIQNANIVIKDLNATTIYGFHGGVAENCQIIISSTISSTIYGTYGADVKNSYINIYDSSWSNTLYGIYSGDNIINNCINVAGGKTTYSIYSPTDIGQLIMGNRYMGAGVNINSYADYANRAISAG